MQTPDVIQAHIREGLLRLETYMASWVTDHLIQPRLISVQESDDKEKIMQMWLVTDHTGDNDASLRIVFDEKSGLFGHEFLAESPKQCSLLLELISEDFAEVVQAM
ncbi:MAG: hypothetical protein ACF8OB_11545 [Phycisphaeraceae bacterium JB051]